MGLSLRSSTLAPPKSRIRTGALAILALLCAGFVVWQAKGVAAASGTVIPAPTYDQTSAQEPQTAVLAGGCFWGVQGVFQHVRGVVSAVSGYSGGAKDAANYEAVSTGTTGHAESVKITFDPNRITYGKILQIYFSVVQDPTELDRQGPDVGSQYRSAIFPANADQALVATRYIAQLGRSGAFAKPIVTKVEPFKGFYPAEAYHQNFLTRHPNYPYIVINDLPKIKDLKRLFPGRYRPKPVLVSLAN